ncbi:MAG: MBOAT family protein [Oscillospiraceae bacterium]|jgi:alginate O-acetyltransferase complex protein AlgI|nr:MBOAT family protein [Oscillospiraceae bacterium]
MLFSSVTFLFYFLPLTLALYFLTPMPQGSPRWRNLVLLTASFVFYAWSGPRYLLLMAALGLAIARWRGRWLGRLAFALSCGVSFGSLLFFKYADFALENLSRLSGADIPLLHLALPVGISFYTFQITSYTFDLHRGDTELQRNFFTFAAYVTLFPQLIAGPIVRYADVARELRRRDHSLDRFSRGVRRFAVGLGKKVLLANTLDSLVEALDRGQSGAPAAWLYLAAYAPHIYFDFSGYSDMAIGMGHMVGFRFLENFEYPYTAKSISEFWWRWHISLSTWFRDYVYIPLGGNRVKPLRFCLNILIVWSLTGFWHGAEWTFCLWGLYYAVLLLAEKFLLRRWLPRWPKGLAHCYALLFVLLGWVFFDAPSVPAALHMFAALFGAAGFRAAPAVLYYLRSYAVPLLAAAVGATPLPAKAAHTLEQNHPRLWTVLEPLGVLALLALCAAFLVDGSFNPFIYFRF